MNTLLLSSPTAFRVAPVKEIVLAEPIRASVAENPNADRAAKIQAEGVNAWFGENPCFEGCLPGRRPSPGDCPHRAFGLREIHLHPLP